MLERDDVLKSKERQTVERRESRLASVACVTHQVAVRYSWVVRQRGGEAFEDVPVVFLHITTVGELQRLCEVADRADFQAVFSPLAGPRRSAGVNLV